MKTVTAPFISFTVEATPTMSHSRRARAHLMSVEIPCKSKLRGVVRIGPWATLASIPESLENSLAALTSATKSEGTFEFFRRKSYTDNSGAPV